MDDMPLNEEYQGIIKFLQILCDEAIPHATDHNQIIQDRTMRPYANIAPQDGIMRLNTKISPILSFNGPILGARANACLQRTCERIVDN